MIDCIGKLLVPILVIMKKTRMEPKSWFSRINILPKTWFMELDFLYSSISFLKKEEGYYVYSFKSRSKIPFTLEE